MERVNCFCFSKVSDFCEFIEVTHNYRSVYTTAGFGYGTDKNGTGAKKKSSDRVNF